ncbi:MAG TPA: hypothetical protein PK014_07380 [Thermoanaerobaculia bacterium]|nr:hypothetical protein [Thermoanaerobaculia bacterium]HUM29932.1 hypothetical protein [Thermoanaerobaculia bacterium]HXK68201.1 hypothetical protein [Thermoanaerobaculia bacterium]
MNKSISLLFLFAASLLVAQEDIYVNLQKAGITRYRLGVKIPEETFSGSMSWLNTLSRDLILSEAFELMSPSGDEPEDPEKKFAFWKNAGVDFLLTTTASIDGDNLVLTHNIYDTKTRKVVLSKRYRGQKSSVTTMAHTLADEIVLYFTGRRGVSQTRIAFVSDRSGAKEIYFCDADGSNPQPLTAHKDICLSPAWSPDGERLAFTSFVLGKPALFMLIWRQAKLIKLPTGLNVNTSPVFSPEGDHMALAASQDGNTDVYMMNLNTGAIQRLTHTRAIDTNPTFSPNGQELIFTSDRTGTPQLYLMDREGVNVRRLTTEGSYNDEAAWSPAGNLIAYASRENNRFQIKVMDILTGNTATLTTGGNNESPSFSPDGQRIAFTSDRSGESQVYTMNIDGSRIMQLTTEGSNFSPAWSPYLVTGNAP